MNTKNKYMYLTQGLTLWAFNNNSPLLIVVSIFGIFQIRKFAKADDNFKLLNLATAALAFNAIYYGLDYFGASLTSILLVSTLMFLTVVRVVVEIMMFKEAIAVLISALEKYDLKHLISKIQNSYITVIAVNIILGLILLIPPIAYLAPSELVYSVLSIFFTPINNMILALTALMIKFLSTKSFTQAYRLLNITDKADIQ